MSYPYGGYGAYDPYALMGFAGYGGYGAYGGYGGLGMMPNYGSMSLPYMNYGNTFGGYGSPGYNNLSYGKALVSGKRYSTGSGAGARGQSSNADMPIGNCFGRPGCMLNNS
ncbi:hypothetical protein Tcan_02210 [Toxocara canis]|uniref:Uncharacterized protein n=1 Tax=Toxocara canis TaxID=6265 RepID=A0A0B2UKB1_TOXCA|nr:hypothetical protein Tcan_02210 [Toxocara canis]